MAVTCSRNHCWKLLSWGWTFITLYEYICRDGSDGNASYWWTLQCVLWRSSLTHHICSSLFTIYCNCFWHALCYWMAVDVQFGQIDGYHQAMLFSSLYKVGADAFWFWIPDVICVHALWLARKAKQVLRPLPSVLLISCWMLMSHGDFSTNYLHLQ